MIPEKTKTGEFHFQFDDDESFYVSDVFDNSEVSLTLKQDKSNGYPAIEFTHNEKKFKIFIKPI